MSRKCTDKSHIMRTEPCWTVQMSVGVVPMYKSLCGLIEPKSQCAKVTYKNCIRIRDKGGLR